MTMTSVSSPRTSGASRPSAPIRLRRLAGAARWRALVTLSAACAMLVASSLAVGSASAASKLTETFSPAGAEQSFVVPVGVTSVRVRAIGAAGETAFSESPFQSAAPGGAGAVVASLLPVTPGETLYVEVASRSYNGGGQPGLDGGGAGGGASDVRTVSESAPETLQSRLLVAAGGGGGGGTWFEGSGGRGGDAGSPGWEGTTSESGGCCGEGSQHSAGGAAGTLTGAGAGGQRCESSAFSFGREGSFGVGGEGGEEGNAPETGGGGGGGGYWGGGGGEGSCEFAGPFPTGGGGGGGGSSYVSEEATSTSFGLASLTTEPSVSITYATPSTATPDSSTVAFPGTQPLSTVSAPQTITLTNSGGNPLAISSETFGASNPVLASDHPEDFLIDSSSCLGAVVFEATCQLKVRFAPQGTGTRTASLQIAGNMGAGPTTIALTGTGGTLPQGPQGEPGATGAIGSQGATGSEGTKGETGSQGPAGQAGEQGKAGTAGPQGPAGSQGPVGPKGAQGPRGLTATYVCHPRRRHGSYQEACFVSVRSASVSAARATLERSGVVYASGAFGGSAAHTDGLRLFAGRKVSAGRYTLVLTSKHGTHRETVTVG